MSSCVYCCVDSWKILADVLWVTKIHNPSLFIVTEGDRTQTEVCCYCLDKKQQQ